MIPHAGFARAGVESGLMAITGNVIRVVSTASLTILAMGCAGSPAPAITSPSTSPPTTTVRPIALDGAWSGRGIDSKGETSVNWNVTQDGNSISGTVRTQAIDPTDGSCNSCHRNKRGTFTGTLSGTTLTVSMFFAAGGNGDPTPECSSTLTGSAADITDGHITATYAGADTCEGPFVNGTMTMARGVGATELRPARRD